MTPFQAARTWARGAGALLGYVLATAGRSAVRRALPLYLSTGIVAFVLFAGQGLDARTVTVQALTSLPFRAALLGLWLLGTLPGARAWLQAPETELLLALPVSRPWLLSIFAAGCCCLQLPWLVLWWRGAGLLPGVWACGAALAVQMSWLAGLRSGADWLILLGAAVLAGAAPGAFGTLFFLGAFLRGVDQSLRRAPERQQQGGHWVVGGTPLLAFGSALAAATLREHTAAGARVVAITLGSAPLPVLALQRGGAQLWSSALLVWGPACIVAAATLSGPVLRVQRGLFWLVQSTGAVSEARRAGWLVLACAGVLGGAAFALVVASLSRLALLESLRLAAGCATAGAAWSVAAGALVRRSSGSAQAPHAGQLVMSCGALCAASSWLFWVWPLVGLPILLAGSGLLVWWVERRTPVLA
jgi:hypothetical protein